jgi:hypothetical protein
MLLFQGSIANCFASIFKEQLAKRSSWILDGNTILDSNQGIKCTLTILSHENSENVPDKRNDNAWSIHSSARFPGISTILNMLFNTYGQLLFTATVTHVWHFDVVAEWVMEQSIECK